MNLSHPPKIINAIYSSLYWKIPTEKKEIFITFDDGPTEEVTAKVLQLLKRYEAKATFFCLGKNVVKLPELFNRIKTDGHAIGNHTYDHINGWKTATTDYIANTKAVEEVFQSNLFRPPYGRIRSQQIKKLSADYRIIMWSTLSMDYNKKYSREQCLQFSIEKLEKGSIIVFHDSEKAKDRMFYALEGLLNYCQENDWKCSAIEL